MNQNTNNVVSNSNWSHQVESNNQSGNSNSGELSKIRVDHDIDGISSMSTTARLLCYSRINFWNSRINFWKKCENSGVLWSGCWIRSLFGARKCFASLVLSDNYINDIAMHCYGHSNHIKNNYFLNALYEFHARHGRP